MPENQMVVNFFRNGSKFADDFFSLSGKISALRKNCPKRTKTACFCPNGSKMVVKEIELEFGFCVRNKTSFYFPNLKIFQFREIAIFRIKQNGRLTFGSRPYKSHLHIASEHCVYFLCRLFKVTFVHAVVGSDCGRYVLVSQKHLNDFGILSALEQHARIGVTERVEVKAVFVEARFFHEFIEHRARTVIGAKFALFVAEYEIIVVCKGNARVVLHISATLAVLF